MTTLGSITKLQSGIEESTSPLAVSQLDIISTSDVRYRLRRWALQAAAREILPGERVAWCLRRPGWDAKAGRNLQQVLVMFSARIARAHYKNLMVCGSVWHCPLCAAKISEGRRRELTVGINRSELEHALVSVTLQHQASDRLHGTLAALLGAWQKLKSGRAWQEFKDRYGVVGTVRALEVTWGSNGWHPHLHILFFFRPGVDVAAVSAELKQRWVDCLKSVHRSASLEHGIDVRSANSDVVRYVAKWGHEPRDLNRPFAWSIEHELTKGGQKFACDGASSSMLGLLDRHLMGEPGAGELWREYALEFKGKKQLVWSHGLRELLGLGVEATDQELAEQEVEPARLLAALSLSQWRHVLGNDARGELLEVASKGDAALLWVWLRQLGLSM